MKGYGQFCPVAKAAEVLAERWTPLVLRELTCGSTRFNDLRRGVPLMSSSLLSQRLKFLEQEGVIERRAAGSRRGYEYQLTDAGRELEPLIRTMGEWGARWVRSRLGPDDLDVAIAHVGHAPRRQAGALAPPTRRGRVRVHRRAAQQVATGGWCAKRNETDLCMTDPGFEVDLFIATDLRTMTAVWMGDVSLQSAMASGDLEADGPTELRRRLKDWLGLSAFAPIKSQRPSPPILRAVHDQDVEPIL